MTQPDVLPWLQNWFKKHTPNVEPDLVKLAKVEYLTAGYIDSQGVVNLIVEMEKTFDVAFSMDRYEDPNFLTVGGLAGIVTALRGGR